MFSHLHNWWSIYTKTPNTTLCVYRCVWVEVRCVYTFPYYYCSKYSANTFHLYENNNFLFLTIYFGSRFRILCNSSLSYLPKFLHITKLCCPGGSVGDNLPVIQGTQVQFLGWEDPLEKGMTTHSSILAWNSMDRGAWWAIVHGITKSQTKPNKNRLSREKAMAPHSSTLAW